jgi:hypothetical protein
VGAQRRTWGVYDLPLWRDWLAWLTAFGLVAAIPIVAADPGFVVLAVPVQVLLFGILPGSIRAWWRARRATA